MEQEKNRFGELEGLRGVAAIMVAFYHYFLAFYALLFLGPYSHSVQHMRYEDNLYGNPIMAFLSGTFAVAIFFVLSGFVLSIGFFQTGKLDIVKKLASKRYLRLMLPALASILIAFILISLGLSHVQQAAAITHSEWLKDSWKFVPSFLDAVINGVAGIFTQNGSGYNDALWTMTTEFLGSFAVFGFLALFVKSKYKNVLYVVLLILTFNSWYMAFIAGMILADWYASGKLKQLRRSWAVIPVLALGLFLAGYPYFGAAGTIYQWITIPGLVTMNWNTIYLTFGAIIVVSVVLATSQIAAFFRHKYISWLGKYTFSLYLVHLSVLYTFTTFMFLVFFQQASLGFNASALLAIAVSIPIVAGVTYLFEKYIDAKSIQLSGYVANIVLGYQRPSTHFRRAYKKAFAYARRLRAPNPMIAVADEQVGEDAIAAVVLDTSADKSL